MTCLDIDKIIQKPRCSLEMETMFFCSGIPALYDSVTTYIPLDAAWYFRAWVATRHDLGTYKEALEWWLVR